MKDGDFVVKFVFHSWLRFRSGDHRAIAGWLGEFPSIV
jgi:hypothetical protein